MSLERGYINRRSESQKLYGSSLPPSLRWGAARQHATTQNQEAVFQPAPNANSQANLPPATPEYIESGEARNGAADALKASEVSERMRRPYAIHSAVENRATPLLLQDTPEYLLHSEIRHGSRRMAGLEKPGKWNREEDGHEGSIEPDRLGSRNLHATVDDVTEDDGKSHVSVVAGAEEDANVNHSPEHRRQVPSRSGSQTRGPSRAHVGRKNINNTVRAGKNTARSQAGQHIPVYAKIHVEYLSTETLRYYNIPWEYDKVSLYFEDSVSS